MLEEWVCDKKYREIFHVKGKQKDANIEYWQETLRLHMSLCGFKPVKS
jgi:hypothetical protein